MSITVTTHLNLHGTAREALEFYLSVFGGESTLTTYGDLGMPADAPDAGRVVFGQVQAPGGFRLMAYDVPGASGASPTTTAGSTTRSNGMTYTDQPFFVSVRGDSLEEVRRYWEGLTVGGTIVEDLAASAWSPGFGMVTDSFGVTWILDVAGEARAD